MFSFVSEQRPRVGSSRFYRLRVARVENNRREMPIWGKICPLFAPYFYWKSCPLFFWREFGSYGPRIIKSWHRTTGIFTLQKVPRTCPRMFRRTWSRDTYSEQPRTWILADAETLTHMDLQNVLRTCPWFFRRTWPRDHQDNHVPGSWKSWDHRSGRPKDHGISNQELLMILGPPRDPWVSNQDFLKIMG